MASMATEAAGDVANPVTSRVLDCLNSKCPHCGFKRLWSQGLRKHLVVRRRRPDGTFVDDLKACTARSWRGPPARRAP